MGKGDERFLGCGIAPTYNPCEGQRLDERHDGWGGRAGCAAEYLWGDERGSRSG
jgi:hypothetical protein